jgi:hypothetical protein
MAHFTNPDCRIYIYNQDKSTKWYLPTEQTAQLNPIIKGDLKIDETRTGTIKAPFVIHGRQLNKSFEFFTGMKPTGVKGWSYGDTFRNGKKSIILFSLSEDKSILRVYYFNAFYPAPNLKKFLGQVIPHLHNQSHV